MSDYRFSFPACIIAGKGRIDPQDVILMRKYAFPDGIICATDADALLALHRTCPIQCPQWEHYFVESLASFVVREVSPAGSFDEAKAEWLVETLALDGVVRTPLELELLLHAMELAADVPDRLSAFALDQVRKTLAADGYGGYAENRPAAEGVTAHDLTYIWRVMRRGVDRGRLLLSPLEARVLKEIDLLASPSHNHPGWNDLIAEVLTLERSPTAPHSPSWLVWEEDELSEEDWAA